MVIIIKKRLYVKISKRCRIVEKVELNDSSEKREVKKKKNKRHPLFYKIFSFIFIVLTVVAFSFAIYNDIFPLNILLISGFFIVFIVLFITFLLNSRLRIWLKRVLLLFTILIMILEVIFLQYGANTIEFIKNINDNGKRIDESVLKNNIDIILNENIRGEITC